MSLLRMKRKTICPCCGHTTPRWLYRVNGLWYCVECLHSCFGMGPAKIARVA